ncbi:hypothetical protein HRR83_008743 [Exophiala dermatitidis]|uniref:Uncharacterized protein n=2 Tax=Exophiala dermatitidis TaxID=5970 RepID=H6BXI3_EXODN|nr:uncharacterized protein HMPREF1120_04320 [Exophiala dermatitidis NIH/UT8656]KAJ4503930.1 hypothetical protein HRR75_007953 [Exophiala dermatitidis]EHY56230.1 hypothetical protein HMPREF1120_04320 [Exophiala dermatitidis NIH/UT8656]KAJ4505285.1 hypothetical protein HRR73_008558 [Exophiala dermatitidis]KAJ4505744.1 hypothetical protein HRR74_008655 [Exophiala dermatitidis]KAJ4536324.1 hypothetical protein HRR77_007250 [Exophiala dermatitidis]
MLNLYTETAFSLRPATTSSVVDFSVPRAEASSARSRISSARTTNGKNSIKDEDTFTANVLASQSSIYCRQCKSYPRTFYWRVLHNGRVLEVRCADYARSENDVKEAYFTLRFDFHNQILPRGVCFADLDQGDELHVFVCTDKNELLNLQLPTAAFRDPTLLRDESTDRWCRPVDTSTLGIETVHQLWASSPLEVFLTFTSGKLQKISRRSVNGAWKQDNYDDRSWGASLRGIVSRRGLHTIEYGSHQVDARTAQAMATSPDGKFLFTICLNHTLRAWDLYNGNVVATKDLLGIERDPNDRTRLNPAEAAHIQVFKLPNERHPFIMTYTPHEGGQFKVWEVKGGSTDSIVLEDKYPGFRMCAPDPDPSGNTVWSMVGFKLHPPSDLKPAGLWVLWRNHNFHQLYNCRLEFGDLESSWASNWVICNPKASSKALAPEFVKADTDDPASKWLEFFFYPERYSESTLETALAIFTEATAVKLTSSQKEASLRQRMCTVIAAGVSLRKYEESEFDYDRFAADTDFHWRNLYRIAENLNESRNAPLALAHDAFSDMIWITMADKCCAVRECSKIELLQQNKPEEIQDLETVAARIWTHRKVSTEDGERFTDMAKLLTASRRFRQSFSAELSRDFTVAIEEELSVDAEYVTPARITRIYNSIAFGESISSEAYEQLEQDLSDLGELQSLDNELFLGILELLSSRTKRPKSSLRNTLFGNLLLSAGVLDTMSSQRELLMDLLALTIFADNELIPEDGEQNLFNASELFQQLLPLLKLCERNLWLAAHTRLVPLEIMGVDNRPNASRRSSTAGTEETRLVTIFEDTLSKAVRPQPAVERPLMYVITDQLSEIDDWASGRDTIAVEDGSIYLQCDLLAQRQYDFATDFLRFQPSTPWSSYVKGRLAIAKGEYDMATGHFRRASFGLACGKAVGNLVALSAGLLSMVEAECFNNGLPSYLYHVASLFECTSAYTQAAYFAHHTLKAMQPGQKEPSPGFRAQVLSRLFQAELKLSRFTRAYDALAQLPDAALQRSCVSSLVTALLNSDRSILGPRDAVETLISLPWAMHPQLARHLDQSLVSLEKKSIPGSVLSSTWPADDSASDYLSVMYAIRLAQKDYRGAVAVLYDRLRMTRKHARARHDPQATALRHALLALINVMACVSPEEAYILAEADEGKTRPVQEERNGGDSGQGTSGKRRRIIITLEDLRKEYQQLLDRCSRIERGDFDFELDEESEDEGELPANQSRLNLSSHAGDAMEL